MVEDALRLVQRNGHFSKTDGSGFDQSDKEVRKSCDWYVDDVVIAKPTLEDHIDWLDEVFGCMKRAGLKCKPSKCEILRDSIKYLGRMVDRHGVRPDPEAVLTWKALRTDTQLMSFLGFANYYREFIKGYADKVYPMQKLMRNKGKKFEWSDEAQTAFENMKRQLCEAPVLRMPTEKGMHVLDTDASVVAISGILHQEQEWNGRTVLRPIAFDSKVLNDTDEIWCTKSRNVCSSHICGKVLRILGEHSL